MKTLVILVVALLLILLATQMENYLGQPDIGRLPDADRDRIDYYLEDFSIMATATDGSVSYNLAGRHLSHWQGQKRSLIINPILQTADGFKLQTAQLEYDQAKREISTDAEVFITHPSGAMQSVGLTAKLDEGILRLNSHVHANYQAH
jgi:lipopolysaccharide export system protein LptC